MANQEHLDLLKQGVETWNIWRKEHFQIQPDLSNTNLRQILHRKANLHGTNLSKADLRRTDLRYANLTQANLTGANLTGANLSGAHLSRSDFTRANLTCADLSHAIIKRANLTDAKLIEAQLVESDLGRANLTGANLSGAKMVGCFIYAVAAWDVRLENTIQSNLVITRKSQNTITVDNLEVAQFIYLLLNNTKIRDVINTLTTKAVLILGRFTPERKVVLDTLREALRTHGYLPILFDFEKPDSRNFTETVRTLAHLSRFIIADLTDPSSIPQELQAIVPTLAVPVQPILREGKREYAMFVDFLKTYHWVLSVHYYSDQAHLLATLKEQVIEPAEQKADELEKR